MKELRASEILKIVETVRNSVEMLQFIPGFPKDRTAGYCTVVSKYDGRPLLAFQVGECKPEKFEQYWAFSQEKAYRLARLIHARHVSSWQSRDENLRRFGGAIRAGDYIFSFSGLPEKADEAVMLRTAILCGYMTASEAGVVVDISDNEIFRQFRATA